MSSGNEERERLRAKRLEAERAEKGKGKGRLWAAYAAAGLLVVAVVVGSIVGLRDDGGGGGSDLPEAASIDTTSGGFEGLEPDGREGTKPPPVEQGELTAAAEQAGCVLRESLPTEGRDHVENSTTVRYRTNPPTSGDHNPLQVADGAYLTPLETDPTAKKPPLNVRNFVHSLEHGRVAIQYDPKLPERDQLLIKGVFDEDPAGVLLYPNASMPFELAATAWTALLGCPRYSPAALDAVRAFRDTQRGAGPEPYSL